MRILTIFVNAGCPGKTLDGRAILVLCGKELQVLVRLTRTAKVSEISAFESRERKRPSGLMLGGGADTMGKAAWLRTIVAYEQMLSCVTCRVQQKIRPDEVARLQWRRLALEF